MSSRVHEAVKAIALCHNVTPVYESNGVTDQAEAEKQYEDSCRVYQASSPDEVNPGRVWLPRIHLSGQTGAREGEGSEAGTFQMRAGPDLSQEWSWT